MKFAHVMVGFVASIAAVHISKTVDGPDPIPVPTARLGGATDEFWGKELDPKRSHDGRIKRLIKGMEAVNNQEAFEAKWEAEHAAAMAQADADAQKAKEKFYGGQITRE